MTVAEATYAKGLRQAQHVVRARGALHRRVAALSTGEGCRLLADLLEDPPDAVASLELGVMLRWVPRIGRSYARSILTHADALGPIGDWRTVSDLSERQRYALADHLYEIYRAGS